jgi:hypothetical protein
VLGGGHPLAASRQTPVCLRSRAWRTKFAESQSDTRINQSFLRQLFLKDRKFCLSGDMTFNLDAVKSALKDEGFS